MNNSLREYFRFPEGYVSLVLPETVLGTEGYFRFDDLVLYGKCKTPFPADSPTAMGPDALHATVESGKVCLPFDPARVASNLRHEHYMRPLGSSSVLQGALHKAYYFVRPVLPVRVRKWMQQLYLKDWAKIPFPTWPVDATVDKLFQRLLWLALESTGRERIPFIWFWPEGATSCAILTHDVETERGLASCEAIMDLDDSFGIRASFQLTPERRYRVTRADLEAIRKRGFEVAVQDLNHDGHLFTRRKHFVACAAKINAYGRTWGAQGFRAAILYRRQEWFGELHFEYDMSVPSVAHLEPQRGGCCTVMPFFIGDILELPVTTAQDYSLFHIFNNYSLDLWKHQCALIMEQHGLMSFIIHPDYVRGEREQGVVRSLLAYLTELRSEQNVWLAMPGEVNRWWRQRAGMSIVEDAAGIRIEGAGKERARIAYASRDSGRLAYTFEPQAVAI